MSTTPRGRSWSRSPYPMPPRSCAPARQNRTSSCDSRMYGSRSIPAAHRPLRTGGALCVTAARPWARRSGGCPLKSGTESSRRAQHCGKGSWLIPAHAGPETQTHAGLAHERSVRRAHSLRAGVAHHPEQVVVAAPIPGHGGPPRHRCTDGAHPCRAPGRLLPRRDDHTCGPYEPRSAADDGLSRRREPFPRPCGADPPYPLGGAASPSAADQARMASASARWSWPQPQRAK